jgi:hypothetical protein
MMKKVNEKNAVKQLRKLERTEKRIEYLRNIGYNVTEMWECRWHNDPAHEWAIQRFRAKYEAPFCRTIGKGVSSERLLAAIQLDLFFGMVECDIKVSYTHISH